MDAAHWARANAMMPCSLCVGVPVMQRSRLALRRPCLVLGRPLCIDYAAGHAHLRGCDGACDGGAACRSGGARR
ncbi:MAG: hypothetical protein R2838_09295 [Caldilineaceae bacterium]